ncbi:MAG: geranylgeranylglycerol-phosphate geranylgeranyltransferase [Paludibacter sp.]|nr:geranylgeranylglycerol-phosphate geranylgeranyltransferase [Paludibacter sp.]
MRQTILIPILQKYGFEATQASGMIGLLIIATVLIAAGGYALNDYFDVKIDAINKPEKQVVGTFIPRKTAMLMHQLLSGLGIILGLLLAYVARSFTLGFIFIVVPGLLWFYSASYKRQFLTGNLTIAFVSAITVLVVGVMELAFLRKEFGTLIFETLIPKEIYAWIGVFSIFSFLCTLIREIIKDMEDEKGDREFECRTMPIKWGIAKTKIFLYVLILITNIALYVVNYQFVPFEGTLTLRYIIFGLSLPFLALGYFIFIAKTPKDFHNASNFAKIIMLIGVLYAFVLYFLQAKTYGISLFNLFIVK